MSEKEVYIGLKEDFRSNLRELQQYAILSEKYIDLERSIYFESGSVNLSKLQEMRIAKKQKFDANHLVHVFRMLLEFILCMKRQGYVHGDIKPENVTVVAQEDGSFKTKVIDFGTAAKNI